MSFKTIVNKSGRILSVIDNGRQILLNADSTSVYPDHVVNAFVSKFGNDSVQVLDVAEVVPAEVKQQTRDVWVANMSGNPDAKDTYIDADGVKDQNGSIRPTKNPFKAPRNFYAQMKGSMSFNRPDPDDFSWVRPDGTPGVFTAVVIEPYKITKVTNDVGAWLKRRMGNSQVRDTETGEVFKHLIISREPPSFRPNLDWGLDDIRYYLILCRPEYDQVPEEKSKLGHSEAQILNYTKRDGLDSDQRLYEAKEELLKRTFFLIADPHVALPTREEFESFKQFKDSKKKKAEVSVIAATADQATLADLTTEQ